MPSFTCVSLAATLALLGPSVSTNDAIASLPTVAVADDPGLAKAVVAPGAAPTDPAAPSVTTKVTVEVGPAPVPAAPAPAPVVTPSSAPDRGPSLSDRYASQAHDDRKRGRALLASGLTVAGLAYLFTSMSGALAIDRAGDFEDDPLTEADESRRGDRRRAYGRALLVPGIGPAIAIARADTAVRAWAAGVAGLSQAVGASLVVLGTHRLVRARRLDRLSVSAMASSTQAHVAFRVRF